MRKQYRKDVHNVIYIQACMRRCLAKKELKALRAEARSVSKFKEISYRLENKVVELTQLLHERTKEKKELQKRIEGLETQVQTWTTRHEDSDAKAKQLQNEMQVNFVPLSKFEELVTTKTGLDQRLEAAAKRSKEQEDQIRSLTEELNNLTKQLEAKQKAASVAPAARASDDASVIATLKSELSSLREQLNRANALNSLTKGAREPLSPTFVPGLKAHDRVNGAPMLQPPPASKRKQRRHSTAGVYQDLDTSDREVDELMQSVKRSQGNPRAVSMALAGADGIPRFKPSNGLSDIYDDPAEEKIRLLEEADALDEDVLQTLIKGLKIPAPNLSNQPSMKEVLFPANLISLITNEMWKYGLIPESERFLANVMQTIQSHVMVCDITQAR
jgi:myosin-5